MLSLAQLSPSLFSIFSIVSIFSVVAIFSIHSIIFTILYFLLFLLIPNIILLVISDCLLKMLLRDYFLPTNQHHLLWVKINTSNNGGGVGWVGGELKIKAKLSQSWKLKLKLDATLRCNLDELRCNLDATLLSRFIMLIIFWSGGWEGGEMKIETNPSQS